LSGSALD